MSKRILIVDDDPKIRSLISQQLTQCGYEVFDAESGMAASLWLNENRADLAITDVVMPEMDGIEFAYEVKRRYPDMPILAISAGEQIMSKEICLELMRCLGAVETLTKPFNLHHLILTVDALMRRHASSENESPENQ